jgi:hypothetical protein
MVGFTGGRAGAEEAVGRETRRIEKEYVQLIMI